MAQLAGIKVARTPSGIPKYVTVDLHRHADLIPFLEKKGFEMSRPVKWTAKMKRSLAQAKNGEVATRNLEELLNV